MIKTTRTISRLAVAIGLLGGLAFTAATPSLAATHLYDGDDNGSVWSYYPGYTDNWAGAPRQVRRAPDSAYGAYGSAYGAFGGVSDYAQPRLRDDPPGSRYQDERQRESDGYPDR